MIPTLGILMSPPVFRQEGGPDSGDRRPRRPRRDGPPDLDEFFRNFNEHLAEIFGQKKKRRQRGTEPPPGNGGGDGRSPQFDPGMIRRFLGIAATVALLAWLGSGFYVVNASERGIVLRFGKYTETTDPGLHWRAPWPIATQEIVNLSEVRSLEIGYRGTDRNKVPKEALMLTNDENLIDIQFAVQYVLKDPKAYLFNNRTPDDAVMQAAETAIREIVGKRKMDDVINTGRGEVTENAAKLMQTILDRYGTGIQISKVTMQNAQPPEPVQAAFSDAVKAGQDRERKINEGQAHANDVIPRAEGASARIVAEAEGYRDSIIATAKGDASRFRQVLAEYAKAPEVTRKRLYLETVERMLASTSKVMIDAKGQGNLLYLPLDKLMQAAAPLAVPQAASPAETPAAGNPTATPSPFSGAVPPQVENAQNLNSQGRNSSNLSRDREAR
ncbi:MAG: FtsH protease activity modulator HflK [Zoogloeaceae bacterium]|jgi:membrane protease subunit HflK|nr:FtsH protease activity modulator HflK [Zoogloeaceae bacterium]